MELTTRQVCLMFFGVVCGFKLIMLPPLLSEIAGNDMWISLMLLFLVDGAYLLLFLFFNKKCNGKTIIEYLTKRIGKLLTRIICMFFVVVWIMKTVIVIYEFYTFLLESLYEDIDLFIFIPLIIVVMIYLGSRRFRTFGRYAELFSLIVVVSIIITIITSFNGVNFENLLPVMFNGCKVVVDSAFKRSLWFGDFSILFLLIGNIKTDKKFDSKLLLTWLSSVVLTMTVSIIFYVLYEKTSSLHFCSLVDIIQFYPQVNSINRLNTIIAFFLPMLTIWLIGLCSALSSYALKTIFPSKPYKNFCVYYCSAAVCLVLFFVRFSYENLIFIIDGFFCYVGGFTLYVLPLLLLLICGILNKFKRNKVYEKTI